MRSAASGSGPAFGDVRRRSEVAGDGRGGPPASDRQCLGGPRGRNFGAGRWSATNPAKVDLGSAATSAINAAGVAVEAATASVTSGRLLIRRAGEAGDRLIAAVERIDAAVNKNLTATLPSTLPRSSGSSPDSLDWPLASCRVATLRSTKPWREAAMRCRPPARSPEKARLGLEERVARIQQLSSPEQLKPVECAECADCDLRKAQARSGEGQRLPAFRGHAARISGAEGVRAG